eukprot:g3389.t1
MRRLCLLAADVNAFQAKELKLVDEIIAGPTSQAFGEADARALAKAQQVASWTTEERHARKCTGHLASGPTTLAQPLELCGGLMTEAADLEALLEEVLSSSVVPRLGPARFSKEMWPHKAHRGALHLNECDECDGEPHSALEGLLAALAELHRTPPGQVRLVQVSCDASMSLGCDLPKLQRAFLLLQLLPAFLGLVSEIVEDEWQLWRSIEEICEKLSECAPTAVAQSKIFIHKVGSFPMNLRLHEDLAGHIAAWTGVLVRWNNEKGFGFIQPQDNSEDCPEGSFSSFRTFGCLEDVFCHVSDLQDGEGSVQEGDYVLYSEKWDNRKGKYRAAEVELSAPGELAEISAIRRRDKTASLRD